MSTASVTGSAFLERQRVELASAISTIERERRLSDLRFAAGGATVTGDLTQGARTGFYTGKLSVRAPERSRRPWQLFLFEAPGSTRADPARWRPPKRARTPKSVQHLRSQGGRHCDAGEGLGRNQDLFNVPQIQVHSIATAVSAGGVDLSRSAGATPNLAGETTTTGASQAGQRSNRFG